MNIKGPFFAFLCQDTGGRKAILPLVDEARQRGLEHILIGSGNSASDAGAQVDIQGRNGVFVQTIEQAVSYLPASTRVIVTSIDSGDSIGRQLVTRFDGNSSVVTTAVHDNWTNLPPSWDALPRPNTLLVNDAVGRVAFIERWRMSPDDVFVTGFPALDRFASFDPTAAKQRAISALGLDPARPIIFPVSQLQGAGTFVDECVTAIDELMRRTGMQPYVLARPHPRLKANAPEQAELMQHAFERLSSGIVIDASGGVYGSADDLIAAADVVLGVTTTALIEKAAMGGNAIAVTFPNTGSRTLVEESKGMFDRHPLASLDVIDDALNSTDLATLLEANLRDPHEQRNRTARREHLKVDGLNARRAIDALMRRLEAAPAA